MPILFDLSTLASDLYKFSLINMFLGCTPSDVKAEMVKQCGDNYAQLRIIFATPLFGMGVDCSGVWQIMRGKDGKPALALLLEHGRSNQYADKEILEYQKTI